MLGTLFTAMILGALMGSIAAKITLATDSRYARRIGASHMASTWSDFRLAVETHCILNGLAIPNVDVLHNYWEGGQA